jgi:hypothetical protein
MKLAQLIMDQAMHEERTILRRRRIVPPAAQHSGEAQV